MQKYRFPVLAISGSLIAAVLVAGCSGAGSEGDKAQGGGDGLQVQYATPSRVPEIKSAEIPALPIEGYLVSQKEKDQILRASRTLAKGCMARYGFDFSWNAASGRKSEPDDNAANRSRRYGIVDHAMASELGYGNAAVEVEDTSGDSSSAQMSEAASRVFLGNSDPLLKVAKDAEVNGIKIPEGGCSGEAKRKVGNGLSNRTANDINLASFQVSLNDGQVKTAMKEWSDCMKRSGYDYASPLDPLKTMGMRAPTPEEKATAAADVQCKYETNLIGIWNAVETEIQKAMIGNKEEILENGRRETDRSLRNAADVLSGKS
ncbi:hypothetical protein ADL00_09105 [Streptomyces sp. AS58]|uniref:hypothetical protein n=1 Tax=Streptomyces sp. AS58 TaxID=1519489 RepID=UPI0006AEFA0F|nr:hypothetical protein [Streptomyces sp. AS58]KOV70375.1 hypothetical protein ADL00_09105 [Streptomyces sp. AS58]